jgi:hypothetical protein
MEEFLATPGPTLLEAVVDPFELPLPAKSQADQALIRRVSSARRTEPL